MRWQRRRAPATRLDWVHASRSTCAFTLILTAILLAKLTLTACGSGKTSAAAFPAPPTPERSRSEPSARPEPLRIPIIARPGRTLVVPIADPDHEAIRRRELPASLAGIAKPARLVRLTAVPAGTQLGRSASRAAARVESWLGSPGAWSSGEDGTNPATDASGQRGTGAAGWWVALLDVPEALTSKELIIDGKSIPVLWTSDPEPVVVSRVKSSPAQSEPERWFVREVAASLRTSPLTRWRGRLYAGEDPQPALSSTSDRFDDPAVEALAQQIEAAWGLAFSRLSAADPSLAIGVRQALARVVGCDAGADGGGQMAGQPGGHQTCQVPFPSDDTSTAALLDDLLDARSTPEDRVQAAREWLDRQTGTGSCLGSWVLDDAPAPDAGGGRVSYLGVLNLTRHAVAASVRAREARSTEASLVPASSIARVAMVTNHEHESQGHHSQGHHSTSPIVDADVRIGSWNGQRRLVAHGLRASPPGVEIGPLVPDWSLRALVDASTQTDVASRVLTGDLSSTVVGRLTRDPSVSLSDHPDGMDADHRARALAGWVLYLESTCENAASLRDDRLLLHFGPALSPTLVLELHSDGRVFDVTDTKQPARPRQTLRVNTSGNVWSVVVPVPIEAAEFRVRSADQGPELRMGIERLSARGVRACWPRPALPWSNAPSRVLIDLGAWDRPAQR